MVESHIYQNATDSPLPIGDEPQLTINRDITSLDLNSSTAFEGPEKLLEVWFSPSNKDIPASASPLGLKSVPQDVWTGMLDLVNCKVLSVIESRNVDAYLLSESSMFVFPHKLVLKTCGTTTLLYGLPRLLEIAALHVGFPHVKANAISGSSAAATPYRVFYSRKNFLYPEQQQGPHRSWRDEVRYLDTLFRNGSAYMIGKMNGEHWYLYITGPDTQLTPPSTPEKATFCTKTLPIRVDKGSIPVSATGDEAGDETMEILMTDLDESNARQFYLKNASKIAIDNVRRTCEVRKAAIEHLGVIANRNSSDPSISGFTLVNGQSSEEDQSLEDPTSSDADVPSQGLDSDDDPLAFSEELTTEGHTLGSVVTEHCGLADVYPSAKYPDSRIDSYLFTPCGYSANGVVPAPGDADLTHYWTVHVTPEPQCSYASFETNVPIKGSGRTTVDVIQQVVGIFKPGRFSVTIFEAQEDVGKASSSQEQCFETIKGYRRVDRIVHDLDGYQLVFRYFERDNWEGGAPRLGEP